MKKAIVIIAMLLASAAQANSIADWLKTECGVRYYGLHLVSEHIPRTSTNNGNAGVYLKTKCGFLAGAYHNSYFLPGSYVGWESPEWIPRIAFDFVLIRGYKHISGLEWTPGIVPNVRLYTLDQAELRHIGLNWQEVSLRMLVVPKHDKDGVSIGLLHFGVEARF